MLIDGEIIDILENSVSQQTVVADEVVNEKYVKGEIRIVTEQARYPLDTITSIVSGEKYRLDPEYQRRHRWSNEKRSRLIESLIMNVPIPPIFLYEYEYSQYEVMDGLQRLSAIDDFYNDRFTLEGLDQWPELNGRLYSTLPEKVREGIDRRYLSSVILLRETAKSSEQAIHLKQMVFERINSGGEPLTPQESRNAILDGPMNRLCLKLSRNLCLCRLWAIPEPTEDEIFLHAAPSSERIMNEMYRRMEDVELVLRFFAYRQKQRLHKGGTRLSSYLDAYLRSANNFPNETLVSLKDIFESTIALVEEVFGEQAFWLYRKRKNETWYWYSRPTLMVYDSLMFAVSQLLDKRDCMIEKREDISSNLVELYRNNYELLEGRDVNPSTLQVRDSIMLNYLRQFC
jgi:hypothetical protein